MKSSITFKPDSAMMRNFLMNSETVKQIVNDKAKLVENNLPVAMNNTEAKASKLINKAEVSLKKEETLLAKAGKKKRVGTARANSARYATQSQTEEEKLAYKESVFIKEGRTQEIFSRKSGESDHTMKDNDRFTTQVGIDNVKASDFHFDTLGSAVLMSGGKKARKKRK